MKRAACLVAFWAFGLVGLPAQQYEPNWESLDGRPMPEWFHEARFGIFVVWGPYSVPAYVERGYSEWYRYRLEDKESDTWRFHERVYGADFRYEDFAERFRAELFDPEFWVDLFVRAGARYVVTTANYHDGFCLYPSAYDGTNVTDRWNSVEVGPRRDLLGELNEAGRRRGLRMGIYYSLYEWFHPLWLEDRDRYVVEKLHPQFKEVVTAYEPDVIFLDGEWEMDDRRWRSEELCAWLFNESPVRDRVVVNDRWGQCRGQHGSVYDSEYGGGNLSPHHPWQENRGIGHSYGYNRMESIDDYDTGPELVRMLSKVTGNGGNYLLCVGPTADGRIPVIMQQRLLEIGAWLGVNGPAIYGARPSPFWPRRFAWGTCTWQPAEEGHPPTLYAHVWGPPSEPIALRGLRTEVTAAHLLGGGSVAVHRDGDRVTLDLPNEIRATDTPVVALELAAEPDVDLALRPEADGRLVLGAIEAELHGASPRYESGGGKDNVGYWGDPNDWVSWTFVLGEPGTFEVEVTYSCAAGAGGSRFDVVLGDGSLAGQTNETGTWNRFHTETLGRVALSGPGPVTLEVRPRADPTWRSMGLKSIVLRPVE